MKKYVIFILLLFCLLSIFFGCNGDNSTYYIQDGETTNESIGNSTNNETKENSSALFCVHINTTQMYNKDNQLTNISYFKELGDIHYSSLTSWLNLPVLENFQRENSDINSTIYSDLTYVVKNNNEIVEIKNGDTIYESLFNENNEITIYIKFKKSEGNVRG